MATPAKAAAKPPKVTPLQRKLAKVQPYTSELVTVPEWADVVIEVRSLTVARKNELMVKAADDDGDIDLTSIEPEVVLATCFDPDNGELAFADFPPEWIAEQQAAAVTRLSDVGFRLSGFTGTAVEEGKDDS